MNHLVYQTTNTVNNKVYIGVHSTQKVEDGYLGSGTHLKKSIEKYGKESFKREVLFNFDTREEALKKESELVNIDFVLNSNTYNLVLGGGGANIGSSKTTEEELRAIEKGFTTYKSFIEFTLEFGNYQTVIKYKDKQPLNIVEISFLKMFIKDGGKMSKKKLIKYRKFQFQIIGMIQYVIYGK